MENIKIEDAKREDASAIADAILVAIGDEITLEMAGEKYTVKDVHDAFQRLAEREETQYSYRNTRVARAEDGSVAGVAVSYDGADLMRMRRAFFKEANENLGWNVSDEEVEAWPAETDPDELYLDTLMVRPEYRRQGIARALIADAKTKAEKIGKPLGLLCDLDNDRARRVYESSGLSIRGQRPFAGHMMYHMQNSVHSAQLKIKS